MLRIYPSNASVWLHCAGAPKVSEPYYEKQLDSEAKQEGICAHWVFEQLWEGQPVKSGDIHKNGVVVTDEMVEYAEELKSMLPPTADIELKFSCDHLLTGMEGRVDAVYTYGDTLHLWDYKFGHSFVNVFENEQLLVTTASLLRDHTKIVFHIYQPRCFYGDGAHTTWELSASRFKSEYLPKVTQALVEATSPDPEVNTGAHCRSCVGRHACEALRKSTLSIVDLTQEASTLELPPEALGKELGMLLDAQDRLKSRIKGLEQQTQIILESGKPVQGFTLVNKQGNLAWTAAKEEVISLGDLLGLDLRKPSEPITPAQAIKLGVDEATVHNMAKRASKGVEVTRIKLNKLKEVFKR